MRPGRAADYSPSGPHRTCNGITLPSHTHTHTHIYIYIKLRIILIFKGLNKRCIVSPKRLEGKLYSTLLTV